MFGRIKKIASLAALLFAASLLLSGYCEARLMNSSWGLKRKRWTRTTSKRWRSSRTRRGTTSSRRARRGTRNRTSSRRAARPSYRRPPRPKVTIPKTAYRAKSTTKTTGKKELTPPKLDWLRKEPSRPGEVTVFVRDDLYFTGTIIREDDERIAIRVCNGELEWNKGDVKKIVRYESPQQQASSQEGKGEEQTTVEGQTTASAGWLGQLFDAVADRLIEKLP